jgi:hypothetical protein
VSARAVACLVVCLDWATAAAQPVDQSRTILVAEGGSYDVAVHPDFVTIVYLPDTIQKAIASDTRAYEVKPIGATSLAIRPLTADARPASLALVSESLKVSVVLRIAATRDEALTQVTFKRADVEAEVRRRIDAGVKERTAELETRIARMQATMDAALPALADGLIAARLLQRRERRALDAIERNDDNVVAEATEVFYLGDDAYIMFAVENRGRAPFRLAIVEVRARKRRASVVLGTLVRFTSDAAEAAGKGVIGVVRPGGTGAGVIVVRRAGELLGTPLAVVIAGPHGRGRIVLDRIVLR